MSVSEICRKWDIANTYAYKLKDRAMEILKAGINKPVGRVSGEVEQLRRKVSDLEQLAGDQALVIHYFKKSQRR
jgi:polyhydroxyalkanoate synthesis regulator phasin